MGAAGNPGREDVRAPSALPVTSLSEMTSRSRVPRWPGSGLASGTRTDQGGRTRGVGWSGGQPAGGTAWPTFLEATLARGTHLPCTQKTKIHDKRGHVHTDTASWPHIQMQTRRPDGSAVGTAVTTGGPACDVPGDASMRQSCGYVTCVQSVCVGTLEGNDPTPCASQRSKWPDAPVWAP